VGDSAADVSMYSFGTLKTSTALGGAVLRVRDREVLGRMRGIQPSYPFQDRGGYLKKLLKVLGLLAVSRPRPYGLLAGACTRLESDLDALVNGVVCGFPPQEPAATFFRRLRHRPSAPLLAMLSRRLRTFDRERLARRASSGERFASGLREAPAGRSLPTEASLMMSGVVFLPVYPELPSQAFDVMAGLVNDCAARGAIGSVAQ
jgi:perosamine synthetase